MGTIRVIQLTNDDGEFYRLMGPFLARRDVIRDIGGPIHDDPGKIWFIALDGERVAGFAAITPGKNADHFGSTYVLPEYRNQGIYKLLLNERLAVCSGDVVTTVKDILIPYLRTIGFQPVDKPGKMKKYTRMIKKVK